MGSLDIQALPLGLVSFSMGIAIGYYLRGISLKKNNIFLNDSHIVLLAVTAIWVISMLVDIASPTYETSPLIHGLMGAIVGFFYKPATKKD
jgi:hypothetical protein